MPVVPIGRMPGTAIFACAAGKSAGSEGGRSFRTDGIGRDDTGVHLVECRALIPIRLQRLELAGAKPRPALAQYPKLAGHGQNACEQEQVLEVMNVSARHSTHGYTDASRLNTQFIQYY